MDDEHVRDDGPVEETSPRRRTRAHLDRLLKIGVITGAAVQITCCAMSCADPAFDDDVADDDSAADDDDATGDDDDATGS